MGDAQAVAHVHERGPASGNMRFCVLELRAEFQRSASAERRVYVRIAVVCETSAADRQPDIMHALEGRGYMVFNAGMKRSGEEPSLSYIQTGFLSALLLNSGRADLVVGGCGTGQGYLNACMQYPGVCCGLIQDPLDAWLFRQINDGNCISLALHKGYGWASEVNLAFIFDRFFSVDKGRGFPPHRADPQRESRDLLTRVGRIAHHSFAAIVRNLDEEVVRPVLTYPGVKKLLNVDALEDAALQDALRSRDAYAAQEAQR